ncbi:LuxR family transcriptional regulator [Mesorhizobium sp. WSM4303]|uniref:helix-turn-helix transcriptional regulator n=1 Tax=unclassified Mesorhizobium TaxID=325217 RepID=UPI00115F02E6|nr:MULTISPECIES: LuxR family transcriptional regulator [unclassified Mesorhizobium]TRC98426.1 LuxR family transcriptional regulator [Mesorhizobium sp. WSM4306]TRC99056.1 LuxR family transcriptional regulator [Mesorhizobium sp. WSM4303]
MLLEEVRRSRTAADICTCLLSYGARFGATNLLAGVIPPPHVSGRQQISHVLLDAWPRDWSLRYFSNGYLRNDPTIRLVSRGNAPFLWKEIDELCKVCLFGRRVMEEATEFRLCEGLTLAFSTLERQAFGFSVAGEKLELDPYERLALQLVAAYTCGSATLLAEARRERGPVHLSPRQRDVLHWVSEGLTVDEIGDRLNISSHTADMHLRAVREKFGVTSSIQAVAEAFRHGLIK